MIWNEEDLKAIQVQEINIFTHGNKIAVNIAHTEMMRATEVYLKRTKPVSKPADVTHIGRNTYNGKGELIGFYLEPIYKAR